MARLFPSFAGFVSGLSYFSPGCFRDFTGVVRYNVCRFPDLSGRRVRFAVPFAFSFIGSATPHKSDARQNGQKRQGCPFECHH